jgi:hypothetical protein
MTDIVKVQSNFSISIGESDQLMGILSCSISSSFELKGCSHLSQAQDVSKFVVILEFATLPHNHS